MEKKKIHFGLGFYIPLVIAFICALLLFVIVDQEEKIDNLKNAIEQNNTEAAKVYVDELININIPGKNNKTALMLACEYGNGELIEYVVQKGADVNYAPNGMPTPLELFCEKGYCAGPDALRTMFSAGLKQSKYTLQPAIFTLANNFYWMDDEQKEEATEVVIVLLKNGAPLGYNDTTILHLAAKADMDDLFYTVVHTQEGIYMLNAKNEDEQTAWEIAVKFGAINVQKVIRNLEQEYKDEQGNQGNEWTEIITPDEDENTEQTGPTTDTKDENAD